MGLEYPYGAGGTFLVQPSLLRPSFSVLAAALSLDCVVSLIADGLIHRATGAPAFTVGGVTIHLPSLVPTSDPRLLCILACFNAAFHSQRAAKDRMTVVIRR